jgi:hypothetical protein
LKRRFATSSPPELVYFSDENLGRIVFPSRVRAAGVPLEIHADHFEPGTPDVDWLKAIAERRWILLTLDARLRYNRLERDAIMASGLAAFVLSGGKTHHEKAEIFIEASRRIPRFIERNRIPFIAKIHTGARITLWLDRQRWTPSR